MVGEDSLYDICPLKLDWDLPCGLTWSVLENVPVFPRTCVLLLGAVLCVCPSHLLGLLCCSSPWSHHLFPVWLHRHCFLWLSSIPLGVLSYLTYPFIHWWTFGLFLHLGYCGHSCRDYRFLKRWIGNFVLATVQRIFRVCVCRSAIRVNCQQSPRGAHFKGVWLLSSSWVSRAPCCLGGTGNGGEQATGSARELCSLVWQLGAGWLPATKWKHVSGAFGVGGLEG